MAKVIKYINKKRYIRGKKTWKSWRVQESKLKEQREKKEGRKEKKDLGEEKMKIQTRDSCPERNQEISKIYWIPYQEVAICKVGEGKCPRTMGPSEVPGNGSPHLKGGSGGLCHKFI